MQEGAFLVAFSGHFPLGKQSTEEKSRQQGAFAALSPVLEQSWPCTWSPFPFPCAEPELGFLLQAAQSRSQGAGQRLPRLAACLTPSAAPKRFSLLLLARPGLQSQGWGSIKWEQKSLFLPKRCPVYFLKIFLGYFPAQRWLWVILFGSSGHL